ncbi:hypothetical protein D3C86_1713640 [compost metagenome]
MSPFASANSIAMARALFSSLMPAAFRNAAMPVKVPRSLPALTVFPSLSVEKPFASRPSRLFSSAFARSCKALAFSRASMSRSRAFVTSRSAPARP